MNMMERLNCIFYCTNRLYKRSSVSAYVRVVTEDIGASKDGLQYLA